MPRVDALGITYLRQDLPYRLPFFVAGRGTGLARAPAGTAPGAGQHALLDHLVRPRQERLRDREAYLPGSAEIEREPDLVVILDR